MTALLIRHAATGMQDTLGQRAAVPLSPEGQMQARQLAARLKNESLAAVFTSPLLRAVQTAEILAEGRGISPVVNSSLREIDVGDWDNRTIQNLSDLDSWKLFNSFRSGTRCPGGEMMIEVQSRAIAFFDWIAPQFRDLTVAVVSHADVIRASVCHYLGVPLDLSLRIQIAPASMSSIEIHDYGVELRTLNQTI